jgi:hypothetical protein
MYESIGMKPIQSQHSKNGKEGQLPVDGTINRGFVPYEYTLGRTN